MPAGSIPVGTTGMLGTENLNANTGGGVSGTLVMSYIVEPETSTTALVNIISKTYNASSVLTLTQQDIYRISPDTASPTTNSIMVPVTSDLQYTYSSLSHLIYTYQ